MRVLPGLCPLPGFYHVLSDGHVPRNGGHAGHVVLISVRLLRTGPIIYRIAFHRTMTS